jgi:type I restriction enzyme S subunit
MAVAVDTDRQFMFQRHIAHIKPVLGQLANHVATMLNAPQSKHHADSVARGVAQKTVTLGHLARFPIPLAPADEQLELQDRLGSLMRIVSEQERAYEDAALSNATFGAALLQKAFRGELVPQDPNDEPAEALLARLRESTTSLEKPKTRRRRSEAAE